MHIFSLVEAGPINYCEVYYRLSSTLQTALWGNGNFVLCDVFLFYKSGHKPFKGSANEGFYKSVNSLKCTAPFFTVTCKTSINPLAYIQKGFLGGGGGGGGGGRGDGLCSEFYGSNLSSHN